MISERTWEIGCTKGNKLHPVWKHNTNGGLQSQSILLCVAEDEPISRPSVRTGRRVCESKLSSVHGFAFFPDWKIMFFPTGDIMFLYVVASSQRAKERSPPGRQTNRVDTQTLW
mmetsp:Transcript_22824/g.52835  ORF Transcript_22824/g.52835 Transcript_22824/m.52835 type:complete len:114 (+) Transcript_22824:1-342(+)